MISITGVSVGTRMGCSTSSSRNPARMVAKPVAYTSLFRTLFSRPNRMMELLIPRVTTGSSKLPISTIILVMLNSAGASA